MLGVMFAPPSAGTFEALLYEIAMRALDLTGADGEVLAQRLIVVELIPALAEVAMTDPNGGLIILDLRTLLMRGEGTQNGSGVPVLQARFLFVHPCRGRFLRRCKRLGCCGEVFADVPEIHEIVSVLAKPFADLVSNPGRPVAYCMQLAVAPQTCAARTVEENSSGVLGIALHGAAVGQGLAALGMCQSDLGFLPAQVFAFAPVGLGGVRVHDRDHAAIDLGNDPLRSGYIGPRFLQRVGLEHGSGVRESDASNDAFAEQDAIVFDEFVHGSGKGDVGGQVGHRPLQRA